MNLPLTTPTDTPAVLAERELWADALALEELLIDITGQLHLTDADLDRLDRQLRRVLLRVSHLAEAREEGR